MPGRSCGSGGGRGTSKSKFHVIANGRNEGTFSPGSEESRRRSRDSLGVAPDAPLLIYVGSVGPQYHPREMLGLFEAVHRRRQDARFLVLTGDPEPMNHALSNREELRSTIIIRRVPPAEVPTYIAASDLGLAFRTPSLSQRAVSPIKVAEYLLCGVPVVSTAGVGDLDSQIVPEVGRLILDLQPPVLETVADWAVSSLLADRDRYRTACRAQGLSHFGLGQCTDRYKAAIAALEGESNGSRTASR